MKIKESKIKIRPLTINDYPRIRKIWREVFELHPTDSLANTRMFLQKNPNLSLVAKINKEIVGVVLISYNGRIGYMCRLAVKKKFQRRGMAKELIKNAEKKLQQIGAKQIFLYCQKDLIPFYQKAGYRKEKNCVVMLKDL